MLYLWDTHPNPSLPASSFRPKSPSVNCAGSSQHNAVSPFGFLHKLHRVAPVSFHCDPPDARHCPARDTSARLSLSGEPHRHTSPASDTVARLPLSGAVTPAQLPAARPGAVTPARLPRPGAVPRLRSPRCAAGAGRRRRGAAAGAEVRRAPGRGGGAVLASGMVSAAPLLYGERSEAILRLPPRCLPERFRPDPHGATRA